MSDDDPGPDSKNLSLTTTPSSTGSLYISNVSEDVWPFISEMSDPETRKREIAENALFSDRDLLGFAGKDNLRLILPQQIKPDFWQYYLRTFGNKNTEVWIPDHHSGEICRDILSDETLVKKIREFAGSGKKLQVFSYSTSIQFLKLVRQLRDLGITVVTPEAPEESDAWTVNFFGSKSGIRQLAQQSVIKEPDFKMSEGVIVSGISDAAKIAANMYVRNDGVVIKVNKGHAGMGVYIWRAGDLSKTYYECQDQITQYLMKDRYWEKFPIVVEELVNINPSLGGGNPNVEFKVLKTGEVKFLYGGGMRVTKEGIYKGMEVSKETLPEKIMTQMIDTGYYIGEQYAAHGYRGYYDVDFVGAKNGQIYVTESNVRRTGCTHAYLLSKALFGEDFWYDTYSLSTNFYKLPDSSIKNFSNLYKKLEPVLFNPKTKEGLVIASANLLAIQQIGYVIFGKTKGRALTIEEQMEHLLGNT